MKTTLLNFFKNAGVLLFIATFGMSCSDNDIEIVLKKGTDGPFPDYGKVLAFPGAEGFGRNTTNSPTVPASSLPDIVPASAGIPQNKVRNSHKKRVFFIPFILFFILFFIYFLL